MATASAGSSSRGACEPRSPPRFSRRPSDTGVPARGEGESDSGKGRTCFNDRQSCATERYSHAHFPGSGAYEFRCRCRESLALPTVPVERVPCGSPIDCRSQLHASVVRYSTLRVHADLLRGEISAITFIDLPLRPSMSDIAIYRQLTGRASTKREVVHPSGIGQVPLITISWSLYEDVAFGSRYGLSRECALGGSSPIERFVAWRQDSGDERGHPHRSFSWNARAGIVVWLASTMIFLQASSGLLMWLYRSKVSTGRLPEGRRLMKRLLADFHPLGSDCDRWRCHGKMVRVF